MEHYEAKIEKGYRDLDNPEAANLSFVELSENPGIAFPEEDKGARRNNTIDLLLKGN